MSIASTPATGLEDANRRFWDELCGTALARSLGVADHSADSLRRFDEAYFALYPFLTRRVPVNSFAGLRVLEVGLGYGTLGQMIAQAGAAYTGLDVAAGPVAMMRHRLGLLGIKGEAVQGSMLAAPFADASFDRVVSIGCFHHTGDTQRCLDEAWRLLRPGGVAHVMVYNRYAARRWQRWPATTAAEWLAETVRGRVDARPGAAQRGAYDSDSSGAAAPETEFFSARQLRRMLGRFHRVELARENVGDLKIGGRVLIPRRFLLGTIGRCAGQDIYVRAEKQR
jgi:SAM-dependent methyltransferase